MSKNTACSTAFRQEKRLNIEGAGTATWYICGYLTCSRSSKFLAKFVRCDFSGGSMQINVNIHVHLYKCGNTCCPPKPVRYVTNSPHLPVSKNM